MANRLAGALSSVVRPQGYLGGLLCLLVGFVDLCRRVSATNRETCRGCGSPNYLLDLVTLAGLEGGERRITHSPEIAQ